VKNSVLFIVQSFVILGFSSCAQNEYSEYQSQIRSYSDAGKPVPKSLEKRYRNYRMNELSKPSSLGDSERIPPSFEKISASRPPLLTTSEILRGNWQGYAYGNSVKLTFLPDQVVRMNWKDGGRKMVSGTGGWSSRWDRIYLAIPSEGFQGELKVLDLNQQGGKSLKFVSATGPKIQLYRTR